MAIPAPVPEDFPADPQTEDLRPMVGRAVSNRGPWVFGALLAISAVGLFAALESRRVTVTSPATAIPQAGNSGPMIAAPPDLVLNELAGDPGYNYAYTAPGVPLAPTVPGLPASLFQNAPRGPNGGQNMGIIPGGTVMPPQPRLVPTGPNLNSSEPFVISRAAPQPPPLPVAPAEDAAAASGQLAGSGVSATRLSNPGFTVPQGAVIQAVLETALDSNRPGFARAIVSRDVRGFDGSRVLIPRGSRLFGEYKSDLAQGQRRAFVNWQLLTRPDGVQIRIESPAADPLGRAGIGGNVNTHFFQRFAGAILQSALDVGVGLASRSATNGTVVLGLPGSTQNTQINPNAGEIRPTLTIRNGTSVSVFVARDLDFSTVE
jgi:type IV secretion system protein VirB10